MNRFIRRKMINFFLMKFFLKILEKGHKLKHICEQISTQSCLIKTNFGIKITLKLLG